LRNLIGYTAFWLKKYEKDNDQNLGYLIKICLGHSFIVSGTNSDYLSATPAAEQKSQTELHASTTVTTTDIQGEPPITALGQVTYSMQHVYDLLINSKNILMAYR
jgi:hypothetical protein